MIHLFSEEGRESRPARVGLRVKTFRSNININYKRKGKEKTCMSGIENSQNSESDHLT